MFYIIGTSINEKCGIDNKKDYLDNITKNSQNNFSKNVNYNNIIENVNSIST